MKIICLAETGTEVAAVQHCIDRPPDIPVKAAIAPHYVVACLPLCGYAMAWAIPWPTISSMARGCIGPKRWSFFLPHLRLGCRKYVQV